MPEFRQQDECWSFANARVLLISILACILVPDCATVAADAQSGNAIHGALADALQANGPDALQTLRLLDSAHLSSNDASVRDCMMERLGRHATSKSMVDDPTLAPILATYQEYWLRSLLKEHSASENDAWLLESLNRTLVASGAQPATTLDGLEPALDAIVAEHGYHSLFGVTSPLREFMLWRTETTATYDVALPEGRQSVVVVFLDDFASLGWAGFSTCDRVHSGGWTKPDALYAVRSSYDLNSENFRVSYLAHEGQHFADQKRFPTLTRQVDLEYRAKLTEVALANESLYDLLDSFAGNMGADDSIPHSFANGELVRGLCAKLHTACVPPPVWEHFSHRRLNRAAINLLREDTRRRLLEYR